jgi:hypothetical protein
LTYFISRIRLAVRCIFASSQSKEVPDQLNEECTDQKPNGGDHEQAEPKVSLDIARQIAGRLYHAAHDCDDDLQIVQGRPRDMRIIALPLERDVFFKTTEPLSVHTAEAWRAGRIVA